MELICYFIKKAEGVRVRTCSWFRCLKIATFGMTSLFCLRSLHCSLRGAHEVSTGFHMV